jgi:dipicolinate synthase subunit B
MKKYDTTVGFAITGSFCTFDKITHVLEQLVEDGAHVIPIFSVNAQTLDTRFGQADEFVERIEKITGHEAIRTIEGAEPIGPKGYLDVLVIAPCTGNTMAKLCNGITDTPVLMAAKAHLRNEKPLVISMSSNDALGMNLKNIGMLMNMKNIYFVPFGQDNYMKKPNSMIAHVELLGETIEEALKGKQLQPLVRSPF